MVKRFVLAVSMLSLTILLLIACDSDSVLSELPKNTPEISEYAAEIISNTGDEGYAQCAIQVIVDRYLTRNPNARVETGNINLSIVFDISTQGASFTAVYDDYGNLEYLGIDIFGEMGRITHSYTFTQHFIVYTIIEVSYSEPFFINPMNIPISDVYSSRFVLFNGNVHRFVDEGEYIVVQNELRDSIITELLYFLEIIMQ